MKVLIIYAHPSGISLNKALKDAFIHGAKHAGHSIKIIDLYAERFNPVLSARELKGELSPQVKQYQQMMRWADQLVFFYPVWWFRAPAILEGFFDKVFTSGFAYKYRRMTKTFGTPKGLLLRRGIIFETYGAPWWAIKFFYFDVPWSRLKRGVLKFCGVRSIQRFAFFSTPYASAKKRDRWIQMAEKVGNSLKK